MSNDSLFCNLFSAFDCGSNVPLPYPCCDNFWLFLLLCVYLKQCNFMCFFQQADKKVHCQLRKKELTRNNIITRNSFVKHQLYWFKMASGPPFGPPRKAPGSLPRPGSIELKIESVVGTEYNIRASPKDKIRGIKETLQMLSGRHRGVIITTLQCYTE